MGRSVKGLPRPDHSLPSRALLLCMAVRMLALLLVAVPTRIRAPGCYAFQVDGVGFSYVAILHPPRLVHPNASFRA
jgi:hypothetical protein